MSILRKQTLRNAHPEVWLQWKRVDEKYRAAWERHEREAEKTVGYFKYWFFHNRYRLGRHAGTWDGR
jgi:hypothetical protein